VDAAPYPVSTGAIPLLTGKEQGIWLKLASAADFDVQSVSKFKDLLLNSLHNGTGDFWGKQGILREIAHL